MKLKSVAAMMLFTAIISPPAFSEILYNINPSESPHTAGSPIAIDGSVNTPSSQVLGSTEIIAGFDDLPGNQAVFNQTSCFPYDQIQLRLPPGTKEVYLETGVYTKDLYSSNNGFAIMTDSSNYGARRVDFDNQKRLSISNKGGFRDNTTFHDEQLYSLKIHADAVSDTFTVEVDGTELHSSALGSTDITGFRFSMSRGSGLNTGCSDAKAAVSHIMVYEKPEDIDYTPDPEPRLEMFYHIDFSAPVHTDGAPVTTGDSFDTPSAQTSGSTIVNSGYEGLPGNWAVFKQSQCNVYDQIKLNLPDNVKKVDFEADVYTKNLRSSDNNFAIYTDSTGYGSRSLNFHGSLNSMYVFNSGSGGRASFSDEQLYRLKIHADAVEDIFRVEANGSEIYSSTLGSDDIKAFRLSLSPWTGKPDECTEAEVAISNIRVIGERDSSTDPDTNPDPDSQPAPGILYDVDFATPLHTVGAPVTIDSSFRTPSDQTFGSTEVVSGYAGLPGNWAVFNQSVCGVYDQLQFDMPDGLKSAYFEAEIYTENLNPSHNNFSVSTDSIGYGARSFSLLGLGYMNVFNFGELSLGSYNDQQPLHLKIHADAHYDIFTVEINGSELYASTLGSNDISSFRLTMNASAGKGQECSQAKAAVSNIRIYESPEAVLYRSDAQPDADPADQKPDSGTESQTNADDTLQEVAGGSLSVMLLSLLFLIRRNRSVAITA